MALPSRYAQSGIGTTMLAITLMPSCVKFRFEAFAARTITLFICHRCMRRICTFVCSMLDSSTVMYDIKELYQL